MAIKAETSTTVHKTIRLTGAQVIEALGKRRIPEGAAKVSVGIETDGPDGVEFTPLGEDQRIVVQFDVTRGAK